MARNNAAQAVIFEIVRRLRDESGHPPPPAPPSVGAVRPLLPERKVIYTHFCTVHFDRPVKYSVLKILSLCIQHTGIL